VEELRTLLGYDEVEPAVDKSLKSLSDFEVPTGDAFYWTATEQSGGSGSNAWQIKFRNGYIAPADKISAAYVRCVHEAPPENFCECPDCPVCEPEIKEVEKIVEVPAECPACPVCPVCEPEIVEVPVEKIVYVDSPCSCKNCDLTGLTTYSELKAKQAELSKAIKELKKCHVAATRAMYKAREAERKALMAKKKAELAAKLKAKKNKK
jgi:hypothetical protein